MGLNQILLPMVEEAPSQTEPSAKKEVCTVKINGQLLVECSQSEEYLVRIYDDLYVEMEESEVNRFKESDLYQRFMKERTFNK